MGQLTPPIKPLRTITRTDLARFLEMDRQRRELNRQAYLIAKQMAGLEADLVAWVTAKAPGKSRTVDRSGYRLSIVSKPGSVSWKAAFVEACGDAAAEQLAAAAPPRDVLVVEKL